MEMEHHQLTLFSLLIASLMGSVHCAGMCGGFVTFCSSRCEKKKTATFMYHFGRLIVYASLGAIAGTLGHSLNHFGGMLGIQKIASILMGTLLIAIGLKTFFGRDLENSFSVPPFLKKIYAPVLKTSGLSSDFSIGLLSALLPCGWLYSFVAMAAASGSLASGLLIMVVFWAGTLPALLTITGAIHLIRDRFRLPLNRVVGILVITAGLTSLGIHHFMLAMVHHH